MHNDEQGRFIARALGETIFTEADVISTLKANIREAVACHFEAEQKRSLIRLHFVSEEVMAA